MTTTQTSHSFVIDFLNSHGFKYRDSGNEVEVGCLNKECPNQGQPQLYINKKTGAFFCHRCGIKGASLKQLQFKLGMIKASEPVSSKHIYISEENLNKWQSDLRKVKEAYEFLKVTRCLNDSTINQFRLGYIARNEGEAITIPYFDKSGLCVGVKYYYYKLPPNLPKIKFEKNSKVVAYNLNGVDLTEEIIITEGEIDAMSMWQYGFMNVVSMPNGANSVNGWVEDIATAPKFVICTDNDIPGAEASEELGKKLGLSKCVRMFPPFKDINECLQLGMTKQDIEQRYNGAEPMFNAPVTDITAYKEGAIAVIKNPVKYKGVSTGWSSFDSLIGGIRDAEVTVSSGMTGDGKTTFGISLISNLIKKNVKCLIISPEMQEQDILLELASNYYRKKVDKVEELENYIKDYGDKVFIANVFDEWTNRKEESVLDRVFDIIEYSIKHKGVKFILVDHLRLFLNPKDVDKERFAIDEFMSKCVHTVISTKCHLWLIVQPKNLPHNQRKVTKHDLKGSGNIGQDTHNIVLIHRHKEVKKGKSIVEVEVAKCRSNCGTEGTITLDFDMNSKANYYEGAKNEK